MTAVVRLERTVKAPPRQVYRAWLEPELLRQWMAPGDMRVVHAEVDERVGGSFRIGQVDGAGVDVGGFEAELVELIPDERIVYHWGFVGPERSGSPRFDSLLTITLRETPEGTTALALVHERLEELAAAWPQVAEGVGPGWELALDKLTATIQESRCARSCCPTG